MEDKWLMFPVTMGEDQAFISFNESFAERAKSDARHNHLRVEVAIRDPTEAGMPRGDEFKALSRLDDALEATLAKLGGLYVGRITVAGRRYFYFYLGASEVDARDAVARAGAAFGYAAQLRWAHDPEKTRYWKDLYPTADDWQVIKDMWRREAERVERGTPRMTSTGLRSNRARFIFFCFQLTRSAGSSASIEMSLALSIKASGELLACVTAPKTNRTTATH